MCLFFLFCFVLRGPRWVFVSVCGLSLVVVTGGYSLAAVHRLLIVVVSLVAEHGLSSCGAWD